MSGEGAAYEMGDITPDPTTGCVDGVLSWVELHGGWCFERGDAGTVLVAETDGARYELNVGTNERASAADRAAVEAMVASLRLA